MNAIFERTSVRQYTDETLSKEQIEQIVKAGFCAPSAVNAQPWEVIVVTDPKELEELSHFSPYAMCLKEAKLGVVLLANRDHQFGDAYDVMDLSAMSENMLVEARSLGLGDVWLGGYPEQERVEFLKTFFKLPENIIPYWVLSFGHPLHELKPKDKWDPKKVHYNTY